MKKLSKAEAKEAPSSGPAVNFPPDLLVLSREYKGTYYMGIIFLQPH